MGCSSVKAKDAASPGSPKASKDAAAPPAGAAKPDVHSNGSSSSAAIAKPKSSTEQAAAEEAVPAVAPPAGSSEAKAESPKQAAAPTEKRSTGSVNLKAGLKRFSTGGKTRYDKVVSTAAAFIASRVLDKGWAAEHRDVAFCCKAPLAFLAAGCDDQAVDALQVAAAWAELGGSSSSREFYCMDYPQCPWLWICWAATQLSDKGVNKATNDALADKCYRNLRTYSHPILATGLASAPFQKGKPCEADYFATAMLAKAALLRQDTETAELAGDALLRALEANRSAISRGRFSLRWTWDSGFEESADPRLCIQQSAPNQLYFLLGFPAYVMLELSSTKLEKAKKWRAAADSLLDFLKGCKYLFAEPSAHAVAGAAAAAKNKAMATKICDHLASLQKPTGCFTDDSESAEAMDQACEISIWFSFVGTDLM